MNPITPFEVSVLARFRPAVTQLQYMQLDDGTIKAIRWVAVLPATFTAYCVMSAALVVVGKVLEQDLIAMVGIAIFSPIAFAHVGSKIAPSHQKATAVILALLLIAIIATVSVCAVAHVVQIHITRLFLMGAWSSVVVLIAYAIQIRK
jgi:hypothetical protein